jgi:hypothetical protein
LALQVIGAGFGRTGTLSLKVALETLGYGPCHHMMEVMGKPDHIALWREAAEGRAMDWETVYDGYVATVDWPGCAFWRELAELHPEAKVVLSVRDPQRWYESVRTTIYQVMIRDVPADAPAWLHDQMAMVRTLIRDGAFGGRFEDRDHAIAVFEQHNQSVRDSIAKDRLLVFEASEGWAPLCDFLGRPVPDGRYPRLNDGDEFRARMSVMAP